jgi:hypothetical protein
MPAARVAWREVALMFPGCNLVPDRTEVLEARYITREEAFELNLSPQVRRVLMVAFADGDRTYFDAPTWAPPAG